MAADNSATGYCDSREMSSSMQRDQRTPVRQQQWLDFLISFFPSIKRTFMQNFRNSLKTIKNKVWFRVLPAHSTGSWWQTPLGFQCWLFMLLLQRLSGMSFLNTHRSPPTTTSPLIITIPCVFDSRACKSTSIGGIWTGGCHPPNTLPYI